MGGRLVPACLASDHDLAVGLNGDGGGSALAESSMYGRLVLSQDLLMETGAVCTAT